MDGNVGLVPRQIGGPHQDIRKRLLEFDQARGQPGRPQTLGHGDPDFAGQPHT
jgi:hypothetical protein